MITVITPSVRKDMLWVVNRCLNRQTFKDFKWLIVSPEDFAFSDATWIKDPPKVRGDYYSLNKAWNEAFRHTEGELIVNIMDGIWFYPDTLERLWDHYQSNPKAVISGVGNQYEEVVNGIPEKEVWRDPRMRGDQGSFYEVFAPEVEWCLVSFPRKAIYNVGGMPEEYDKGAALSEKITNLRFEKAGYQLYLDQSLTYRAINHPRLSKDWDEKYKITTKLFQRDVQDVIDGKNLVLDYLSKKE